VLPTKFSTSLQFPVAFIVTSVAPDWHLGLLFGLGGVLGMYLGARNQKYVPARLIKGMLCVCVLYVAGKYILGFI
jgi:uncharacterized membrane protein YfcA